MAASPERKQVDRRLADLARRADAGRHPVLSALLQEGDGILEQIAAGSSFLWDLAYADADRLETCLGEDPRGALDAALERARLELADAPAADASRALRKLKQEAALLIALADLRGVWPVNVVTEALTEVADTACRLALDVLLRDEAALGRYLPPDPADLQKGCGYVLLAMGKHGAHELNYSSDIDLIALYDPDAAPLKEGLEPSSFFVRITKGIVRLLSERTADGYVFRVDLRLRPDPGATAIAISLPAAFAYYESVGQNWERAAMIKARPCAGDVAVGQHFLSELTPFIWRRHLDFAAISDIHAMKRQINAHKGYGEFAVAGHNLKLGRGGIREIEFFVQTQQLIAGGRNPVLRGRSTVGMLATLCSEGWISATARDELTRSYEWLREMEHRLQMVADEQTHSLPTQKKDLERFSRFAGFAGVPALTKALVERLETVQRHYMRLFEASPSLSSSVGSLVFTGTSDDPETLQTLAGLGFASPSQASEMIRGWHHGRYPAMRSARAREDLTELTPALLEALSRAGRPDKSLHAFDSLLSRMPSGFQLFSIMRNNPRLLDVIALVLGVAPRLAEMLANRPHSLDGLLEPGRHEFGDPAQVRTRLDAALALATGYEDELDRARMFKREMLFVLGARVLAGELDPVKAGAQIAALAEACLQSLLAIVIREMEAAHGRPPGARICVVGMGKLGGRELTSSSDLDIIVLYDHDDAIETDGPRPIAPSVWFARLTQRLVAALTVPTAQGTLFSVDLRLRPSGQKGPVAINVHGFRSYQMEEAWTWEHMALTRARPIAGDESLGEEISAIVREVLTARRDEAKILADVAEMRALIAKEKGEDNRWDFKTAAGGLIDIEFIAQTLQLLHAADRPEVLDTNTGEVLRKLAEAQIITRSDWNVLSESWTLYTALSQVVRFCVGGNLDPARTSDAGKAMLCRVAECSDFDELATVIAIAQDKARAVFSRLIPGPGKAKASARR